MVEMTRFVSCLVDTKELHSPQPQPLDFKDSTILINSLSNTDSNDFLFLDIHDVLLVSQHWQYLNNGGNIIFIFIKPYFLSTFLFCLQLEYYVHVCYVRQ